jgi:hypothetical protein
MPIAEQITSYTSWVAQTSYLDYTRVITLKLESGTIVYIGFPRDRYSPVPAPVDDALAVGWRRGDHVCKFPGSAGGAAVAVTWPAVARRQGAAVPGGAWADATCCGLDAMSAVHLIPA